MRPGYSVAYTLAVLASYAGACLLVGGPDFDVETLVARLITLGAMGGLGTYYWRIQRNRRRADMGGTPPVAPSAG